jgi:hypothetical protein
VKANIVTVQSAHAKNSPFLNQVVRIYVRAVMMLRDGVYTGATP